MAGRKPKPTAVKKLEGNPGKRDVMYCIALYIPVYHSDTFFLKELN